MYLGIPLATSRISFAQCTPLFEKITARLAVWTNRMLSQAGRLTLINSVLFSMSVYWSRAFILPIKLINMIRRAMSNFFWHGTVISNKIPPCAFSKLEQPKSRGGLGIKNLLLWNHATIVQHIDNLLNNKDNLWVRWSYKFIIGNKKFWTMSTPPSCSWTWRSILNLRHEILPCAQSIVGVNSRISFRNDPWVKEGTILGKMLNFNQQVQTGIGFNAHASNYIQHGRAELPFSSNQIVRLLWDQICSYIFVQSLNDGITWKCCKDGYKIGGMYNYLVTRGNAEIFSWHKRIWLNHNSARQNLVLWKIFSNTLKTKVMLRQRGVPINTKCSFCHSAEENTLHLFFSCPYVYKLWFFTVSLTMNRRADMVSEVEWDLIHKATRWKCEATYRHIFTLKVFTTMIWDERNAIIFNNKRKSMLQMKHAITEGLRSGILASKYSFDSRFLDAIDC